MALQGTSGGPGIRIVGNVPLALVENQHLPQCLPVSASESLPDVIHAALEIAFGLRLPELSQK